MLNLINTMAFVAFSVPFISIQLVENEFDDLEVEIRMFPVWKSLILAFKCVVEKLIFQLNNLALVPVLSVLFKTPQ